VQINVHHGVVSHVSRAAESVSYKDDAESPIDCAEHGRENADICLAASDDDGIDICAAQLLVPVCARPWRIDLLVKYLGWRNEARNIRNEIDSALSSSIVIALQR
jgi:hypothetical protein